MVQWRLVPLVLALAVAPAWAQSEAALREALEGRKVTLKIAMPGAESGVDIYPTDARPLDYSRYADRLKDFGTAIRSGETAMVTRIRVKSKHVEFQLDGGGYGTMGDETSSTVSVSATPKTKREQNLEAELRRETDPVKKREMREELDALRREREREDARNRAEVADAEAEKEQNIRERRLQGGSRFNIRYRDRLPDATLTPEGLKTVLAEYVAFDQRRGSRPRATGPRKGMLLGEADELFGEPIQTSERREGKLKVVTRAYDTPQGRVNAEFVEGVLIRYTVTSN